MQALVNRQASLLFDQRKQARTLSGRRLRQLPCTRLRVQQQGSLRHDAAGCSLHCENSGHGSGRVASKSWIFFRRF